jgi:excisionase family DNA binding protein
VSDELRIEVPPELVEQIARRAAEIVLQRQQAEAEQPRWMTVPKAAAYIDAEPQRIYDLASDGRLTRHKDGSRLLIDRRELDAHIGNRGGS